MKCVCERGYQARGKKAGYRDTTDLLKSFFFYQLELRDSNTTDERTDKVISIGRLAPDST